MCEATRSGWGDTRHKKAHLMVMQHRLDVMTGSCPTQHLVSRANDRLAQGTLPRYAFQSNNSVPTSKKRDGWTYRWAVISPSGSRKLMGSLPRPMCSTSWHAPLADVKRWSSRCLARGKAKAPRHPNGGSRLSFCACQLICHLPRPLTDSRIRNGSLPWL